ncbi:hypothetical protein [Belnapia rosea]|uniref:SH3 domain-containing protein n=1 Tax=Belnapia rosea TaxID=938405 RepID=A0A1G6JQP7_9PROT|nr:hypothetical protein [Belnapia rosea]SDB13589.1 hypothetical protein SAMN02927895_00434 [Belnapia rosea]SDC21082.1 hypothetical protein SAMN04487779_1001249 [Belnapia rosea]
MTLRLSLAGPLALAALLAACAEQQVARQPASGARIYANDLAGGAKVCTVPQPAVVAAGQQIETTMTVDNDGGWCGITVAQSGPKPFAYGTVATRPQHGRLHIHTVGDSTRVDYIPNAAFGGTDSFAVQLKPGDATMRVAVTVNYTAPPAPPAPPAAAPAKPSRTPARRR